MKHASRLARNTVAGAALALGCSGPDTLSEPVDQVTQALDVCSEVVPSNRFVDGLPAYAQCTATTSSAIWSNNGVDTSTTSQGTGWVRTQQSGGYQCTEWAWRYMHFRWNVDYRSGNAGQWCDGNLPATLVKATVPVHGDLIVFAPGACGADATTGHVAVIDSVDNAGGNVTLVEQNRASRRTAKQSCATCFLHAVANDGSSSAGSGGAPGLGGASSGGNVGASGGRASAGGAASGGVTSGGATSGGVMSVAGSGSGKGGAPVAGGSPGSVGGSASAGLPGAGGAASGGSFGSAGTFARGGSPPSSGGATGAVPTGGVTSGVTAGGASGSTGVSGSSSAGAPSSAGTPSSAGVPNLDFDAASDGSGCSVAAGAGKPDSTSLFTSLACLLGGLFWRRRTASKRGFIAD